jgi:amidase
LARVPCLVGTEVFFDWVPETDATNTNFEAGGNIKGKAVCENLCVTPASNSTAAGPVQNPFAFGFTSGGSSSGTGALVANGEIEYGIGAD